MLFLIFVQKKICLDSLIVCDVYKVWESCSVFNVISSVDVQKDLIVEKEELAKERKGKFMLHKLLNSRRCKKISNFSYANEKDLA